MDSLRTLLGTQPSHKTLAEKPEIEQYFFDAGTLQRLASVAALYPHPCCLCTPTLGEELAMRGIEATTLDLDSRFFWLPGFRPYDLAQPEPTGEHYGIIICDPPFLSIPLSQLLRAVTLLSGGDYAQPLLINYLSSRGPALTAAFSQFGLRATGYHPGYTSIQNSGRNRMEIFGNLGPDVVLAPPAVAI